MSYFTAANFINPNEVSFSKGKYLDTWSEVKKETWKISSRKTIITVKYPFMPRNRAGGLELIYVVCSLEIRFTCRQHQVSPLAKKH